MTSSFEVKIEWRRKELIVVNEVVEAFRSRNVVDKMATTNPSAPALDAANADPDAGSRFDFPRDLVGYGRHPPDAAWPKGAKIAVSFVINYEEVMSAQVF